MVSHVKVGGNRFGTKRIFSERESVLDDIRYAVETGGELTVRRLHLLMWFRLCLN